jgi:hypothetical protein
MSFANRTSAGKLLVAGVCVCPQSLSLRRCSLAARRLGPRIRASPPAWTADRATDPAVTMKASNRGQSETISGGCGATTVR